MYNRVRGKWKNVLDISQKLNAYLDKRKWKDVAEKSETSRGRNSNLKDIQRKIISRSYYMATTAFSWSEPTTAQNYILNSFLFTAQKNGIIIVWKARVLPNPNIHSNIDAETDHIEIEIEKIMEPKIGLISSLDIKNLEEHTSIIFIGGLNGTLKVCT